MTPALSQPRFSVAVRPAKAASGRRLPVGYGLLAAAVLSLGLWAGLGWLAVQAL